MSMLAEPKRKQKWSLNPRGKDWSQDVNKYGQKMLERMGWQSGKGLGVNENGITEHIKISYKNDSKGIGYKESNDQWTQHETNFSALLESLTGNEDTTEQIKTQSLEQKSQNSRARVHYHKFTRGKDLSQYSDKDLANIFGKSSLKKPKKKDIVEQEHYSDTKPNKHVDEFLVNAGSMADYFKKKLPHFKKSNGYVVGSNGVLQKENSESDTEDRPFGFGFSNKGSVENSKVNEHSESENEMRPAFGLGFTPSKSKTETCESNSKKLKDKKTFISYISEPSPENDTVKESRDDVLSPKKTLRKDKKAEVGIVNPAFNPMATSLKIQRHSLNTIQESLIEEVEDKVNDSFGKKKKKKNTTGEMFKESPNSDINISKKRKRTRETINDSDKCDFSTKTQLPSTEIVPKKAICEVFSKKLKNKDVKDQIEGSERQFSNDNPNFTNAEDASINSSQIMENPYEVKLKKKKKKSKQFEVINPSFDNAEENFSNISEATENPFEVIPNEKKKKKKSKKPALDNPGFDDQMEEPIDSINPYEVKLKKKKNKMPKDVGIANIALDLDNSKNDDSPIIEEFELKKKKNKRPKDVGITNLALDLDNSKNDSAIIEEFDLMLNVVSTPVTKEKINDAGSVKSRKGVRFSNITQELMIPNNDYIKELSKKNIKRIKKVGLDNDNFNKEQTDLDENVDILAKRLENCQAEVENDINEEKIKEFTVEDIMVGDVGNSHGENENLPDGTKLKFKYANLDTETPFYMVNKTGAKKSYKHLIKGDILVKFNNTNLHEIKGYATINKSST